MSAFRTSLLAVLVTAGLGLGRAQTSPTLIGSTSNLTIAAGASAAPIDLSTIFGLPGVNDTLVQMQTNLGPINLMMQSSTAPISVANFLSYVDKGAYNMSIIHRSVQPAQGIYIIQGGGYTVSKGSVTPVAIAAGPAITNEYPNSMSNVKGTVAFAKIANEVNSATDQWFINLEDNSGTLNNEDGGYTVFATVIGSSLTVANAIGLLPEVQVPNLDTTIFAAVPAYNGGSSTPFNSTTQTFGYSNWVLLSTVARINVYPDSAGDPSVLTFSAQSTNPAAVAATVSGKTLTISGVAPGAAAVTVTATDSNGVSVSAVYNVTVGTNFAITEQPTPALSVASGSTAVLSVATNAAGTTYQWQLNGTAIPGATSDHLVFSPATSANAGSYTCVVTNSVGASLTTNPAQLSVTTATTQVGRLTNLSVLTSDITATQALTLGFVVGTGSPALPLLLRGSGPALAAFSVANYIPDPTVALYSSTNAGTPLASNQGWSSTSANQTAVANAENSTGAFQFGAGSADSALVNPTSTGNYSIVIKSASGASGSTLGEVYDASTSYATGNAHLINLSSKLAVGTGHSLTAGFYVTGATAKTVLIRGVGPSLTNFGVAGVMADPALTLVSSAGVSLAANTGWNSDAQIATAAANVNAFTLTSTADSALLITLPPGGYTAAVTSASGGGGNALVEVYEVP